ncbi:MAG: hypothetical protein ACYTFT_07750 [Planctomycetota bacterium]|jgi:hypothetical protein
MGADPVHDPLVIPPPMDPLPARRVVEPKPAYRFPNRPLPALPPPLTVDVARRVRVPIPLKGTARNVTAAFGRAVAPSQDLGFDPGEQAIHFVEAFRPYMPWPLSNLLPVGLFVLEWGAVLLGPRRGRLSRLDPASARAYFHRVDKTPLRDAVRALQKLTACSIYDRKETHQALDYDPEPFVQQKVTERRERFGAEEPW